MSIEIRDPCCEPEIRLTMAKYLGDLIPTNEVKENVTVLAGPSLVAIVQSSDTQSKEAALKSLYQISSSDASSMLLIHSGILPPLVCHLFSVGLDQLPTRLKEVSSGILSKLVLFAAAHLAVTGGFHTLFSEPVIHNLLQLISNTSPVIEGKLLQVLVGLAGTIACLLHVAAAICSSGAATSLTQFTEAPQQDLRLAAIKLLRNTATHLGPELADVLRGASGQLGSLVRVIAAGLLSDLPLLDLGLTRQMLDAGVFQLTVSRILASRQAGAKASRFTTLYLEGLVALLAGVTFAVRVEPDALRFARDHYLVALFSELLLLNGLDLVQTLSATALEDLSRETSNLTMLPEVVPPGICWRLFGCCRNGPAITGVCRVHKGPC